MESSIDCSVLERVVRTIEESVFRCDCAITGRTRVMGDLKLGRLGRIKLGISIEECFGIELSGDVMEHAVTVDDIVRYLSRHYYRDVDATLLVESEADDDFQNDLVIDASDRPRSWFPSFRR